MLLARRKIRKDIWKWWKILKCRFWIVFKGLQLNHFTNLYHLKIIMLRKVTMRMLLRTHLSKAINSKIHIKLHNESNFLWSIINRLKRHLIKANHFSKHHSVLRTKWIEPWRISRIMMSLITTIKTKSVPRLQTCLLLISLIKIEKQPWQS